MKLNTKQIIILIAGLVTAFLHFGAAFDKVLFPAGPDVLFTLNALGYLGLLGAYFLPIKFFQDRHKLIWQALFGYTILTIVAWLVIWVGFNVIRDGQPFFALPESYYGIPAKITEIILLWAMWSERPQ
jgi:hypothetical protein